MNFFFFFFFWKADTIINFNTIALLHDLKATQMNIQHSLIQEIMIYKFKLNHNATEATKNICCIKGEGSVDQATLTRGFKKFCSSYKKLNKKAKSGRPKITDSKVAFQAIEVNWESIRWVNVCKELLENSHNLHFFFKRIIAIEMKLIWPPFVFVNLVFWKRNEIIKIWYLLYIIALNHLLFMTQRKVSYNIWHIL